MGRWEYSKRRITGDTSAAELDALGAIGWELCGFCDGWAWLKRDRLAVELQRQGDQIAAGASSLPSTPTAAAPNESASR
jgi:hypothetical protein